MPLSFCCVVPALLATYLPAHESAPGRDLHRLQIVPQIAYQAGRLERTRHQHGGPAAPAHLDVEAILAEACRHAPRQDHIPDGLSVRRDYRTDDLCPESVKGQIDQIVTI